MRHFWKLLLQFPVGLRSDTHKRDAPLLILPKAFRIERTSSRRNDTGWNDGDSAHHTMHVFSLRFDPWSIQVAGLIAFYLRYDQEWLGG